MWINYQGNPGEIAQVVVLLWFHGAIELNNYIIRFSVTEEVE
jgi:hypothetical protein